jgi:transcriptional regulator with XRE-family HTH domain
MNDLGTKIRKLRQLNKISQEELAIKLNIAQTSISNIEAGKTVPDFFIMDKICKEFNVDFDYFLESKQTYNVKKNIGVVIGNNETVNMLPEGILENIMKRLENVEAIVSKTTTSP